MDDAGAWVERQRPLERLHCRAVLVRRQRDAAGAVPRRGRAGLEVDGAAEQRLRLVRAPQRQVGLPEPDQRRDVIGVELPGMLEARRRLRQRAVVAVEVAEIVGPAPVARIEGERVPVVRLGRPEVARRHQQVRHLAVRAAELASGGAGIVDALPQRGVGGAHLGLDARLHGGEVQRRHRLQPQTRRRIEPGAGGGPVSGRAAGAGEDEERHRRRPNPAGRPHRVSPVPSVSVVQRSTATSLQLSCAPPGHCTWTAAAAADSPSPRRTRGSLAEA